MKRLMRKWPTVRFYFYIKKYLNEKTGTSCSSKSLLVKLILFFVNHCLFGPLKTNPKDLLNVFVLSAMVLYSGRGAWPARRAIWVLVALLSMEAVAERGRYVTKTLSIPNFTKEFSVLATAKSGSEVVTIAVPIKPCADCSDGNNALFISPVVLEDAAVRPSCIPDTINR